MRPPLALICLYLLALFGTAPFAAAQTPSSPRPTDRARIRVVEIPDAENPVGPHLKVLRTDANTPLRAGTAWLWSGEPSEPPASYYADLRKAGLNAVRLILFDVWMHEEGNRRYDWDNPDYRRAQLARLERAVNLCSANGLYALINAHNRVPGPSPKYDERLNTGLWRAVAPVFANRTHVLYELSNEPITGPGHDGVLDPDATRTLEALARVHAVARKLAPHTHLMILTPAGISGYGTLTAMGNLTRAFEKKSGPLDWTKTSVAYHLYHADVNLFPKAENLRAFHAQFPGWPSENNFPAGYSGEQLGLQPGDNERSVSYGADEFILQTCERVGLGWSQWQINGPDQFRRNWPLLWYDAVAKGYAWKPDLARSP
jgi:hypothetical protein